MDELQRTIEEFDTISEAEQFNDLNPVSLFVPFRTESNTEIALLNVLVTDDPEGNQDRIGASGWAFEINPTINEDEGTVTSQVDVLATSPETDGTFAAQSQSTSSAGTVTIDQFTDETDLGELTANEPASDRVTSQDVNIDVDIPDVIGATFCMAVLSKICDKYGDRVAHSQCLNICFKTGAPHVIVGCSAFCVAAVEVIQAYGCKPSAKWLCGALGLSA